MVSVRFIMLAISQLFIVQFADSAKILGIFAFPGKSHFMMFKAVMSELTLRGHEVTMITNFPMEEKLSNYTEILIHPIYDFWADIKHLFQTDNLFDLTEMKLSAIIEMMDLIGKTTTKHALEYPPIQQLIHEKDNSYDLIIAEQFYQEAFLALAHKYKCPVITMSTLGFENYMSQMMGLISPLSHVPHGFVPFDDKMNFHERIMNTYYSLYEDFDREYRYFPIQDAYVKKYFKNLGPLPSVSEMEKNISLMLLNSYVPLTTSRPTVMGMIQVGGVHIKDPKPLPSDIQQFLDGAKDGAIYFSLGTNLKSSDIPIEKRTIFLSVFGNLKQRVLWKWEDENIPDLPKNVMVKKWLPQSDILSHKNIKVFITHGGLFGTQEGVYRAVPMLGIPVYCDQHLNMNKAAKAGYAISLYFPNITETSLSWALNELMYNPKYIETMRRTSQIFRDRPMSAMDTTMYWIEYIIRYKGAQYIRSSALDLPWYSFYLLDVIGLVALSVIMVLFAAVYILRILLNEKTSEIHEKLH